MAPVKLLILGMQNTGKTGTKLQEAEIQGEKVDGERVHCWFYAAKHISGLIQGMGRRGRL